MYENLDFCVHEFYMRIADFNITLWRTQDDIVFIITQGISGRNGNILSDDGIRIPNSQQAILNVHENTFYEYVLETDFLLFNSLFNLIPQYLYNQCVLCISLYTLYVSHFI